MARWVLWLVLASCARTPIPYDYAAVPKARATPHPLKVAVLPFVDTRAEGEGEPADRFIYSGVEYRATDLDQVGEPSLVVAELVARHLLRAHLFSQVILVMDASQAPEADLFLKGEIYRLRGYVEANAPTKESKRPPDERFVLSEVFLRNLVLRDGRDRVLFHGDAGWALHQPRRFKEQAPEPWPALAETLQTALRNLDQVLATAEFVEPVLPLVHASTTATDLESSSPPGWRLVHTTTTSVPIGWKGALGCQEATFSQKQSLRFHRALGPYVPAVRVWRCPAQLHLRFDGLAEFPSRHLGERDGQRWFVYQVGQNNWPKAAEELARNLGLSPPAPRFEFGSKP